MNATPIHDIPFDIARRAHEGISFVPEKRAKQRQDDYREQMTADFEALAKLADTDEKRATLAEEFARYQAGYRARYVAKLVAASRVMSPMITGPARFPVERNRKRIETEMRRWEELKEFRERALKAIRRTLCPELRPIMAGDADAVERLEAKIAEAEQWQEHMKAVNATHKKYLKDPASLEAAELPERTKEMIRNYKPAYSWEPHPYAPFELTNNNANIRRMRERLEQIRRQQSTPETNIEGRDGIKIEDSPADNRIRLFFPGKPDATIRDALKAHGFRWASSLGCWQAYRNWRAMEHAKKFIQARET